MIHPSQTALFIPAHLKKFKLDLFNRIGSTIARAGGRVVRGDFAELAELPDHVIPIVGCTPELRALIDGWKARRREFVYWDRGYWLRVFATWLPRGTNGGLYRWHRNAYQMQEIRAVPNDRILRRPAPVAPWRKDGRHIVVALPTPTYAKFHAIEGWTEATLDRLALLTDRQIVVRGKESKRPLQADLAGAHALVAHGSNTAVEAAILGCPVFVHPDSAAALVGSTDLTAIERPVTPDRAPWLQSLAYCQFDERELVDGTLWKCLD